MTTVQTNPEPAPVRTGQAIIELKNVRQTYDGGHSYIIDGLNVSVQGNEDRGEFIGLMGASGCGKSTILRYISGLQKPSEGQVFIRGQELTSEHRVGMVFQKYSSLPWLRVIDNVALGLKFQGVSKSDRRARAMELIDLVGLRGHEYKYARYPTLSGGQLQRVAIARSLLASPDILLMDEPFGALDIKTRLQMQDLLVSIWSQLKTTVIFVTHDISEAVYLSDEIWIMRANPGQVVDKLKVDLPFERDKSTKRTDSFIALTHKIEDTMMSIE